MAICFLLSNWSRFSPLPPLYLPPISIGTSLEPHRNFIGTSPIRCPTFTETSISHLSQNEGTSICLSNYKFQLFLAHSRNILYLCTQKRNEMSNHFMFIGFIIFMSCLLFLCATVVWFVCWGVDRKSVV